MKFHRAFSSLLSLLTYFFVHLIISFLLRWGKRTLVTHHLLLQNDGRLVDEDCPETVNAGLDPGVFGGKGERRMGTKSERSPKQPRMLPKDVSEVWRDVNRSLSLGLALSSSGCFSSRRPTLFRLGAPSFSHPPLRSPLSGRVCLFWLDGDSREVEEKHLRCLAEHRRFLQTPEEPWDGIGAFPDTFGTALLLSSRQCSLGFVLFGADLYHISCISCWSIVVQLFVFVLKLVSLNILQFAGKHMKQCELQDSFKRVFHTQMTNFS